MWLFYYSSGSAYFVLPNSNRHTIRMYVQYVVCMHGVERRLWVCVCSIVVRALFLYFLACSSSPYTRFEPNTKYYYYYRRFPVNWNWFCRTKAYFRLNKALFRARVWKFAVHSFFHKEEDFDSFGANFVSAQKMNTWSSIALRIRTHRHGEESSI